MGGEPQARSSSFAFFFLGFCVARGGPRPPSAGGRRSSTPPRRVFSPSFFLFFPLAWQDRARVELAAVKARSSSLGCRPFFFLSGREAQRRGDPCLRGGGTGAGPRTGEGATLFFFGVGRGPQTRFAGGPDGDRLAGAFLFLLFPPFWGGFPWSGHTRGGPGGGLAGRESLDAGLPGPLPVVFPPPPCPPVAPRQADALALRREVIRRSLKSIGFAFVPGLRGAAFEAWPWPRIPRRSVSPGRPSPSTSASTWKKRSGPRPFFFWGFFQC